MTRDGLHFCQVTRDDKATRVTFAVGPIDKTRSIFDGKEVREAVEYEKGEYIVCTYDDRYVHFVKRKEDGIQYET